MTRRTRLHDLSHAQIGALLTMAANRQLPLRGTAAIHPTTIRAMVKLDLFRPNPIKRTATLTPSGFVLADLAVTLSREIAAAVAGLPARLLIEAKGWPDGGPEGEPQEADESAWDRLPPAVRADEPSSEPA